MGQSRRKEKVEEASPAEPPATMGDERWVKPEGLSRRGWVTIGLIVLAIQFPLLHRFLIRGGEKAPVSVERGYSQDFTDPGVVKRDFWSTGGFWRVVNGELLSPGVKNNPLWLKGRLPRDVVVEFDARSESPEGDIKVELFGDGFNHASGYVFIHGGWNNQLSIIARLDEHGTSLAKLQQKAAQRAAKQKKDPNDLVGLGLIGPRTGLRVEANPYPVQIGRTYRWRIERRGGHLTWSIDGQPFMELVDPLPLAGEGHDRFGFSSWDANLYFDNLVITPL